MTGVCWLSAVNGHAKPEPILDGVGENDYVRYMRTDSLLSLQRTPDEMLHRDEALFQVVHQTSELWLKFAGFEIGSAAEAVGEGEFAVATGYLRRARTGMDFLTDQLVMFNQMTPWDFQQVRGALGNGSGLESPGWREVRRVTRELGTAFDERCRAQEVALVDLYRGRPGDPLFALAEALVDWDEAVNRWRVRHLQMTTRLIGADSSGTQGNPVDMLQKLANHRSYPELWQVRNELTALGKQYGAQGQVIAR